MNLVTGQAREEQLTDSITEFGMINAAVAGQPHRYTYAATGCQDASCSTASRGTTRSPAPRAFRAARRRLRLGDFGGTGRARPDEDDAYLVTLVTA